MTASFLIFLKNSTVCEENIVLADHWDKTVFGIMKIEATCLIKANTKYQRKNLEARHKMLSELPFWLSQNIPIPHHLWALKL